MAQQTTGDFDIDPATDSGTELAGFLNRMNAAELSMHSGSTAPAYKLNNMLWMDTDSSVTHICKRYNSTGTAWVELFRVTVATGAIVFSGSTAPTAGDHLVNKTYADAADNQTITLSGDATGSGTDSIAVTVVDDSHNHIISNVDGLQTELDAKVNTVDVDPGGLESVQVFTSTGTWTRPAGITKIIVEGVSGGGGGGNLLNQNSGSGGGGGGYFKELLDVSAIASATATVGAAGAVDGNGGTSSFGSYCSATGGIGGTSNSDTADPGGTGGIASGGTINIPGQNGGASEDSSGAGDGGSSMLGHGGIAALDSSAGDCNPSNANGYGGGGGGGNYFCGGKVGTKGIVIVWEYK